MVALNLWDENAKFNYEASGASSVFTITYKCSFSINTIPYDTSEPTSRVMLQNTRPFLLTPHIQLRIAFKRI